MIFFLITLIDRQNIENIENRRKFFYFLFFSIMNILISYLILYIKTNEEEKNYLNNNIGHLNKEKINIMKKSIRFLNIENKTLNNISDNISYDNYLDITNGWPFNMTKEEYLSLKQKELFLLRLLNKKYLGKIDYFYYDEIIIENTTKLDDEQTNYNTSYNYSKAFKNEEFNLIFFKYIENKTKEENLVLKFNFKNDMYYNFTYLNITELTFKVDEINKIFFVKNVSSPYLGKKLINQNKCVHFIDIEFPLEYFSFMVKNENKTIILNISTINPIIFNLSIYSKCGYKMKIKAKIDNNFDIRIIRSKSSKEDIKYNLVMIFISILNASGIYFLISSIKKNIYLISAISLECYSLNYFSHFYYMYNTQYTFFKIHHKTTKLLYGLSSLFTFGNFVLFDYRFILMIWKIKQNISNCSVSLKKRIQFIIYFVLLDMLFIYTDNFKRLNFLIIIISIFTWTPQIFHNMINNNRLIYPFYYILICSIDKFVFIIYLYKYHRKNPSKWIIIMSTLYMVITIIILYLETFLGARFILPLKFKKKEFNLYKSRNEILNEKPEIKNEECSICLLPFIEKKEEELNEKTNKINDKITENNLSNNDIEIIVDNRKINTSKTDFSFDKIIQKDNKNKNIIVDNKYIINNLDIIKNKKKEEKIFLKINFKKFGKIIKSILIDGFFKFYKGKPIFFKPFILLPCNHFFHSNCLEQWIGVKKECPICRAPLSKYI